MTDYDVIVSGGGIAGLTTALALTQKNVKTLLVTESPTVTTTLGNFGLDLRTLALSPASVSWVYQLGLPTTTASRKIECMRVWESRGSACVDFDAATVGQEALAWTFEHSRLVAALYQQCSQSLEVREGSKITAVNKNFRTVTMNEDKTVTCKLLVIAEGAQSFSRKLLGVPWIRQELNQFAIVTLARLERGHQNNAYQRFGNGVCALLPMPDANVVSVIWSTPKQHLLELSELSDEQFKARIEQQFASACGGMTAVDRRASFPLDQSIAATFLPSKWVVLLGDSAHTLHPLAGQGVNLGLEDARKLVEIVDRSDNSQALESRLQRYASRRRVRTQLVQQAMAFFDSTWSWRSPTTRCLRNIGLHTFNRCELAKEQVIREAMGMGPLARLG